MDEDSSTEQKTALELENKTTPKTELFLQRFDLQAASSTKKSNDG